METSEVLMLQGTIARCPDCGDDRVLLPTDGPDGFCCTSCDAAVFVLDDGRPGRLAHHGDHGELVERLAG